MKAIARRMRVSAPLTYRVTTTPVVVREQSLPTDPTQGRCPRRAPGFSGYPVGATSAGPDVSARPHVTAPHAPLDAKAGKHSERLIIHGL